MHHHDDYPQDPSDIPAAKAFFDFFHGKKVQIYLGENAGEQNYADFSVSNNTQLSCVIKGYNGNVLFVETDIAKTSTKHVINTIAINAWSIYGVMEEDDNIDISNIFQPQRRRF
jgi:hypothetical protein